MVRINTQMIPVEDRQILGQLAALFRGRKARRVNDHELTGMSGYTLRNINGAIERGWCLDIDESWGVLYRLTPSGVRLVSLYVANGGDV